MAAYLEMPPDARFAPVTLEQLRRADVEVWMQLAKRCKKQAASKAKVDSKSARLKLTSKGDGGKGDEGDTCKKEDKRKGT